MIKGGKREDMAAVFCMHAVDKKKRNRWSEE
jgi:hypothetical protein